MEMTRKEKYNEGIEIDSFGDRIETFYINGKYNDYRVTLTTFGAIDEDGHESVGSGAEIGIDEVTDHRADILTYIQEALPDNDWEYETGVINVNPTPERRDSLYTRTYDSPDTADAITEDILEILERIA